MRHDKRIRRIDIRNLVRSWGTTKERTNKYTPRTNVPKSERRSATSPAPALTVTLDGQPPRPRKGARR